MRWIAVVLSVGALATGCPGNEKLVWSREPVTDCVAVTCASQGAECGQVLDGCRSILDCGTCDAPEVCGGGGPNRCGLGFCVPIDCSQIGAECGRILDGCTGVLECGECSGTDVCGAAGPNRCGPGPCLPSSCEDMDAECGLVSNNCGEMLDCGTCAAGLACDSNHRCGACEPLSCTGLCGEVSDDCGSTLDCGPCPRGDSIDIKANGLVSDRSRGKLYVSLPSSFGADGNSVAILDPASGLLEATLFVGSEPTVLAISDDSSTLYVGLAGAPRVVKVDLATFSVVGQFDLRTDSRSGPLFAEQIAVVPGAPDSVAVSTWIKGVSPRHAGVGIWDGGVRRDSMTPGHTGANRIAFTGSPGVLYGYNNESTEFGFRTFAVKPNGLEEVSVVPRVISGFYLDIKSSGDRILSTAGDLVDPTRPSLLGTYGASGPIESDLSTRLTYVVSSDWRTRNTSIEIFDRERFVPRGRVDLGTLPDGLADLVRWGDRGLAFRAGGKIVFVENPLIAGER